jgi:hypothetical protein
VATRTLRKELRRPDEFVTLTSRVVQYAQSHQTTAAWIGAAVVVAVLGALALMSFRHTRWEQANTALARAMSLFNENKLPEATAAFDAFAAEPSNPEEFVEVARLYSAQAALRQGEYAKAAAGFSAVSGGLNGFLAQRSLLSNAFALEGSGQHDDAAGHFRRAADAGGPYTGVAVLGMARNLDRAGKKTEARDAYTKYATDYPDGPLVDVAQARAAALAD